MNARVVLQRRHWGNVIVAAAVVVAIAGCAQLNNPFVDSGAAVESEMNTPSANAYNARASQERPAVQDQRVWPESEVFAENGAVSHWPLWFEDPFEDKGNRITPVADRDAPDIEFAWNWVDYLDMAYSPGRMIFVNTPGWPISAIVTPPGTLMESDGHISKGLLGYDHDAKRADPAVREPPDINIID
ncbi:MAG TPA: hypothetical protein VMV94_19545, partial [Phycisphaerae bacterium]|nr:hypothetical protein [Phycisphaerae bacterium]